MFKGKIIAAATLFAMGVLVASCGNTIEGMGQDTANAIDATQDAGQSIDNAASY
ncbi:putative small secreted protein [Martelella radicis]|uniref:Putative small secreted protein n=1 Tax=Martelella radicis TaxID=1397476 RepID=A0A7W6KJM4_9HYPH|nr:putative small secreted protein [Martelella radicis]